MYNTELPAIENTENSIESTTLDREKMLRNRMLTLTVERFSHLFEHDASEESFANYLESLTRGASSGEGMVSGFTQCACLRGEDLDFAYHAQEIDRVYNAEGAVGVSRLLENWLDKAPAKQSPESLVFGEIHKVGEFPPLLDVGFTPDDPCLQIHIGPMYHFPEKNLRQAYMEGMKEVALSLRDTHPDVRVVVGKSWLFDTGLAKRLGFHVVEGYDDPRDVDAMDGQLLRADGIIDEELATIYKNGGTMPRLVRLGYFTREEFLKKYL